MCVWLLLQNIYAGIILGPTLILKGRGDLHRLKEFVPLGEILRNTIMNPSILVFGLLSTAGIYE